MGKGTREMKLRLILLCWCLAVSTWIAPSVQASDSGTFAGTWVMDGSKEVLSFGHGRETAIFRLSGDVNLTGKIGRERNYWSQCIGLADSDMGSDIRCVWRSLDGDEIYLVLKGKRMEKGSAIEGEIVGGTGAARGMTGTLRFTWSMMSFAQESQEAGISGFSKDVRGSYRLP